MKRETLETILAVFIVAGVLLVLWVETLTTIAAM